MNPYCHQLAPESQTAGAEMHSSLDAAEGREFVIGDMLCVFQSRARLDSRVYLMLNPSQFQPDEAWIAFKLNDTPIRTEQDGDFNCIGLMDAASCFILGSTFVQVGESEPSEFEARRLLKIGWAHQNRHPATLFLPVGQFQTIMPAEAERQGISVVAVHESQLLPFIGGARQSFREYVRGGGA